MTVRANNFYVYWIVVAMVSIFMMSFQNFRIFVKTATVTFDHLCSRNRFGRICFSNIPYEPVKRSTTPRTVSMGFSGSCKYLITVFTRFCYEWFSQALSSAFLTTTELFRTTRNSCELFTTNNTVLCYFRKYLSTSGSKTWPGTGNRTELVLRCKFLVACRTPFSYDVLALEKAGALS